MLLQALAESYRVLRCDAMEIVLVEILGRGVPPQMVTLADEMEEDPRCHLAVLGGDTTGTVLFTVWDTEVATEVEDGVRDQLRDAVVRRLSLPGGVLPD